MKSNDDSSFLLSFKQLEESFPPKNDLMGRMYSPSCATHVFLVENQDQSITAQQFLDENPFYRPLLLSTPTKQKEKDSAMQQKESPSKSFLFSPTSKTPRCPLTIITPNHEHTISMARSVAMEIEDENGDSVKGRLFFGSPDRPKEKLPIHFSKKRKRSQKENKSSAKKLKTESSKKSNGKDSQTKKDSQDEPQTINGKKITLRPYPRNRKKSKSQLSVMGRSARNEILDAIQNNPDKIKKKKLEILESWLNDNYFLEWLHCLGHKLAPKEIEPQQPQNLGAGPKWANTKMYVLEAIADYFSNKECHSVSIIPTFLLVGDTRIIDHITYVVTIEKNGKKIQITDQIQSIDFPDRSNHPSTSDIPQLKRVINGFLNPEASNPVVTTHHFKKKRHS